SEHYSGGMENFPRFLETWGLANVFTYNGSMVKMFPSLYATNAWNNNNNIYSPPKRNWSFDLNFRDPTKLPPLTPSFLVPKRSQWTSSPVELNFMHDQKNGTKISIRGMCGWLAVASSSPNDSIWADQPV